MNLKLKKILFSIATTILQGVAVVFTLVSLCVGAASLLVVLWYGLKTIIEVAWMR
jgi:hypothetical protein